VTKYQPAEPEYEVCWRVSEANESHTSYSVEQADIFQYQSYSHSDDSVTRSLRSLANKLHILARQADIFGINQFTSR
jgi:hypothetical protein